MCMNNEGSAEDTSSSLLKNQKRIKNIFTWVSCLFFLATLVQFLTPCTFGFASFEMPEKHTDRTDKALKGHSAVSFILKTHVRSRKHFYFQALTYSC